MNVSIELEKLKACIHCGMCLPACPTYQVTGSEAESPRGRLYLMRGFWDDTLLLEERFTQKAIEPHLNQCLGCQACQTVCPSGVEYGPLLAATRDRMAKERLTVSRAFKRWVFQSFLPNQALLLRLSLLLRFYQKSGLQWFVRQSGILKLIPALAIQERLLPEMPSYENLRGGLAFGSPDGTRVALMVGCIMDIFYNPVHWATVEVLVANGYHVRIPEQTCCGALAHHAGESDIARKLARENIDKIFGSSPPEWIVLNSAGCGSTMREYGHLLADDPTYAIKAQEFSGKVVDIMELLAKQPLAPMKNPIQKTVAYHAACHLYHAQKVQVEPFQVLAQVPGIRIVPLRDFDMCCGSAGIYNIEHPHLGEEILALKTDKIKATGADILVTGNPGCMLQIQKGLDQDNIRMQLMHPVQLLAMAYGKTDCHNTLSTGNG